LAALFIHKIMKFSRWIFDNGALLQQQWGFESSILEGKAPNLKNDHNIIVLNFVNTWPAVVQLAEPSTSDPKFKGSNPVATDTGGPVQ